MNTRILCGLAVVTAIACGDDGSETTTAGSASMSASASAGATETASNTDTMDSASAEGSTVDPSDSASASSSGSSSSGGSEGSEEAGASSSSSSGPGDESSSSSSSGGPECSPDGSSCAMGPAQCCAGLMCCSGPPIPLGQEFCSGVACPISDRNKKENFAPIDPAQVLAKVAALEITTWNYIFEDPAIRHVGPMAQDFKATFEVGATDKSIFVIDADGVALASIKALHAQNVTLNKRLRALEKRLSRLE